MFNLTCPIGWDELGVIVTAVSAIVSVVAVWVAICGNRKATEQLEMSSEIQEQSKNVELFDKRMGLLEKIKSEETVSEPALQILFSNAEIIACYKEWQEQLCKFRKAEFDLSQFYRQLDEEHQDDPEWESAEDKMRQLSEEMEYGSECRIMRATEEFQKLCEVTLPPDYPEGPPITLNYDEINERRRKADTAASDEHEKLENLMEVYIKSSIEKVTISR